MNPKLKRRTLAGNPNGGADLSIATLIEKREDLGPIVRNAFEAGNPDTLSDQLVSIVKSKEMEIEELCKFHFEEFILAVDELRALLVDADALKNLLSGENLRLQQVGSALLQKLDELLELYLVKKNVKEATVTLEKCIQVLNLCLKCNQHILGSQFYPALRTLELIEKDCLQKIPIQRLRIVIEAQIPSIKLHIENKVSSEFADWLVHIRGKAREIGQLVIGQAASARQRDEELHAHQREAEEQSYVGIADCVYTLDIEQIDEDLVLEINLTPVHRAYHSYTCLGLEEKFRDCYYNNRLQQLNLELEISSSQPFLESYQSYFAQIAGYFIVDDRVLRTAGGLLSEKQVESMWDMAVAKMKTLLEDQISRMDAASHILLVNDFVILFGKTLKCYGYQAAPLIEVLDDSKDKYHELLLSECRMQITDCLASDTFERMKMTKESEYKMNLLSFHLQSSDAMPSFPYVAPFSSAVPDVCRIIRSFIKDSVSYFSYEDPVNFFDMVRQYLDKLLIEVLNEALLKMIHGGTLDVSQAVQVSANVFVVEHACHFFLSQAAQLCGIPLHAVDKTCAGLTARSFLKNSQNATYETLLNLVNSALDQYMALTKNINWTADGAPESENDYINEVIIYLHNLMTTAQQVLPLDDLSRIWSGALEHISDSITMSFLSDSVKRFNLNAVISIDNDLKKLESFADEKFHSTGLSDLNREVSLKNCLIKARQLVNLLLSEQPENFMDPATREKHYGTLDFKELACICEKFKESPDRLFGSLSSKSAAKTGQKKSMDILKRRLKDFN